MTKNICNKTELNRRNLRNNTSHLVFLTVCTFSLVRCCFLLHSTEMLVGEKFSGGFISIGLAAASPFVDVFNSVIIQQVESGHFADFENRWLVEKCVMEHREDVLVNDMITVFQLRGIFYILLVAIILSFAGLYYQVGSPLFFLFIYL